MKSHQSLLSVLIASVVCCLVKKVSVVANTSTKPRAEEKEEYLEGLKHKRNIPSIIRASIQLSKVTAKHLKVNKPHDTPVDRQDIIIPDFVDETTEGNSLEASFTNIDTDSI